MDFMILMDVNDSVTAMVRHGYHERAPFTPAIHSGKGLTCGDNSGSGTVPGKHLGS